MRVTHAMLSALCGASLLTTPLSATVQNVMPGPGGTSTDSTHIDAAAVLIMNRMVGLIGSLTSVSYILHTSNDVQDPDYGTIARFGTHQVSMTGPDQMLVNTVNDQRHVGYWYDGQQVVYYSFTDNTYGVMDAPDNIMATIEQIHAEYGVDFPAADFFYPSFTDDLVDHSTRIDYLGIVQMEGKECFRIVARGKDQTVQLWIANDAAFLPVKYIITDHTKGNAQFQGTFTEWRLNPDIPEAFYEFSPPPGASPLYILPRTTNPEMGE
jgi:hypothetical protein